MRRHDEVRIGLTIMGGAFLGAAITTSWVGALLGAIVGLVAGVWMVMEGRG